jgi:hypothetical protein
METITIKVDADLAREYMQLYREFQPDTATHALGDDSLLEAFVHDRLREEIAFITGEVE